MACACNIPAGSLHTGEMGFCSYMSESKHAAAGALSLIVVTRELSTGECGLLPKSSGCSTGDHLHACLDCDA